MPDSTYYGLPVTEPKKVKLGFFLIGSIVVAAAALLSFGWLAEEVLQSETQAFDDAVRAAIHRLASPGMTSAMQVFSFLGSGTLLVALSLLTIVIFLYIHRPRSAHLMGITMAGAVALDLLLKHAFHRGRPVPFFGTAPSSYSFPSGHAFGSLCFFGALAGILSEHASTPRARFFIWTCAALLVGLIGFSRIYLGVHYPSDVLGGYCSALVWVGAIGILNHVLNNRAR